ncbi:DUF3606 domain-containing protein [Methylobacterium sp. CM6257]
MPTKKPRTKTHFNIYDRVERAQLAHRLGVTEDRLRKAVTMVGSRVSTVTDYLRHPVS